MKSSTYYRQKHGRCMSLAILFLTVSIAFMSWAGVAAFYNKPVLCAALVVIGCFAGFVSAIKFGDASTANDRLLRSWVGRIEEDLESEPLEK